MQGQAAGYRSFTGKNSARWYVYGFLVPFTQRERSQGDCQGYAVKEFWSTQRFEVVPGKAYDLLFDPGYNGRADLAAVVPREEVSE